MKFSNWRRSRLSSLLTFSVACLAFAFTLPNCQQPNEAALKANDILAGGDQSFAQPGLDSFRRKSRRGRPKSSREDYPMWEVKKQFRHDSFTFARVQFDSYGGRGRWDNDFPDCDWNFSARLNELTALQVDPNGVVVRLTDKSLADYPFLFMSNANRIAMSEEEVVALREYLLNGGFLMLDDVWAPAAWQHISTEFRRVFPDRIPRELPRSHEIFNIVYDIQGKPQVPSIFAWQQGHAFEYWHGDPQGDEDPHFWGYYDDRNRLMAVVCHNNDIADGWEREGENREYFREYSERVSYPLGINIVTYVMTH